MLIDFKRAVRQYNMKITGVIHVGAHFGQEYADYKAVGIPKALFIEPCEAAYTVLSETFKDRDDVTLFYGGCGSEVSVEQMNVEQANNGMSNSILKPAKHLEQYPSIQFTTTEEVEIHPLDSVLSWLKFSGNLLVMDVQGYELEVLKGASESLKTIDYIYTEVNRDEVYENCARVEQLDEYLPEFIRVQTSWAGGSWGDAIYIRKSLLK